MTWTTIARQDGRETLGTRSVKVLLGLVAFVVLLAAYLYPVLGSEPITTARFSGYVTGWLSPLVPLVGLLVGYNAVVGERESGALLLSLALPYSRRDVVLGKFAGRAGLLGGTLLAAMVGAGVLVVYPYGQLEVVRSLSFVALTLAYAALWTGLGVAISLSVATKRRALVLAFGVLFLFVFVWDSIETALRLGLNAAGIVDGHLPAAVQILFAAAPDRVFARVTDGFVNPAATVEGPWYLGEWVALVVFVVWLVAPLGLAYRRFAGGDLV